MNQFSDSFCAMVYLIGCALNHITPDRQFLETVSFDALFLECEHNAASALVAYALRDYLKDDSLFTPEQAAKWNSVYKNAFRRMILLQGEREKLRAFLEENNIWYMFLKGTQMMQYYPSPELREMMDTDLLVDEAKTGIIHDHMVQNGYEVHEYRQSKHDCYRKPPVYEVEFHRSLFGTKHPRHAAYFKDIKSRLQPVKEGSSEYRFTDDDFYIYLIAHSIKHLGWRGLSIKAFADVYLYLRAKSLNWDYITPELEKLQISRQEAQLRSLTMKLFSPGSLQIKPELTDAERAMLTIVSRAGDYGDMEGDIRSKIRTDETIDFDNRRTTGTEKRKYVRSRIFLSKEQVQRWYPYFAEHKGARPFLIFYRVGQALTTKRKKVVEEIKTVSKS